MIPPGVSARERAATTTEPRWMLGVFRRLQHWVPAGSTPLESLAGFTYYAAAPCHAPCLAAPDAAIARIAWPRCAACLSVSDDRGIPVERSGRGRW